MNLTDKILLVKILPSDRIEAFLEGRIYMNSDTYFSNMDQSDVVRFDPDEDADEAWQVKEISIKNDQGEYVPIGGVINPIVYRYESKESRNILCLHMLVDKPAYSFDEKNLSFGDSAIVIRDAKGFTDRMRAAAESICRQIGHGPVEYVNKSTHHGFMGPFRKFSEFKYQSEFRYVIGGGDGQPTILELGDLRDICFAIEAKRIPSLLPRSLAPMIMGSMIMGSDSEVSPQSCSTG